MASEKALTNQWWLTIDTSKFCYYCGQPVNHSSNWSTHGMCKMHEEIWNEDFVARKNGIIQNRLKQIMLERGEKSSV